jgi:hypothetical protein
VTAAQVGHDKFKWHISGPLKVGSNQVTFDSKGKEALHFIGAFRVTGNPSQAQILKALMAEGKPRAFVDESSFSTTAVLDGEKAQTTPLDLRGRPGKYVVFCPLTDRDGGKPRFEEGLLTTVTVP